MKLLLLVATLVAAVVLAEDFKGWVVYRVEIGNDAEETKLLALQSDRDNYVFWNSQNVDKIYDVMVSPAKKDGFPDMFPGSKVTVIIKDVQQAINAENPDSDGRAAEGMSWDAYHNGDLISAWIDSLAQEFPDKVTVLNIGQSFENRTIKGMRISFNSANADKAVMLTAGIHAREWVTTSTVTYIANELLRSTDTDVRTMAESYDWIIFPVYNPDGYSYTFTTNRMWRKTLQPDSNTKCKGIDLNRNWPFAWNERAIVDACHDAYPGKQPFSTPEAVAISTYITSVQSQLISYIGFHAYSQMILTPYGNSQVADNEDELNTVAGQIAAAIQGVNQRTYQSGNLKDILYQVVGDDCDWVKEQFNTRWTYLWELPDKGTYGFLAPSDQIVPIAQETMAGLMTLAQNF